MNKNSLTIFALALGLSTQPWGIRENLILAQAPSEQQLTPEELEEFEHDRELREQKLEEDIHYTEPTGRQSEIQQSNPAGRSPNVPEASQQEIQIHR